MKAKRTYRVRRFGLIARILTFFVDSPLTPLIAGAAILLGALAVYLLPREEEPQIVVPMVDVFVAMPGASAEEVAQRAKPRSQYEMGETVRVKEGPFADFSGEVIEINEDQLKVKVLVNIFGRETPVELEFAEVAKL